MDINKFYGVFSAQGPVTIKVARCGDVRIQGSVFSFLQDATFQDILRLELAKEAFALPPREIGRHGPVTTVSTIINY